jgi:type I restriction enzyme S subunit
MVEAKTKVQRYERYKDSELEWLGEIPLNWNLQKLKSFLTVHGRIGFRGYTVNDLVDKGDGAVTISPSNMGESEMIWKKVSYLSWKKYYESPEIIVEEGDLLIVKTASIGKIAYVRELKEKATINPQILVLKNIKINKDYFYYQLLSNVIQHQLQTEKIGSTIYTISENKILNFRSLVPPLSEQTAIAQFLDDKTTKIDEAITIKQQQISLLKERKQILIHKAVTQGLNSNVKLKDSGVKWIGEIPEHWEVTAVKYILEIPITDGPHTTPELLDEGIPFISAEAIKNGEIDFNKKRGFISEKNHLLFSLKYSPKRNDIYMVKSGATTGNIAIVRTDEEFSIWSPLAVFRSNLKRILPQYLYIYLESPSFKKGVELSWSFGTQQNIGMGVLSNLPISFPSIQEQKEISAYIETASQKIETAIRLKQQEIVKLKEYKSSLINGVVTGKVKVC